MEPVLVSAKSPSHFHENHPLVQYIHHHYHHDNTFHQQQQNICHNFVLEEDHQAVAVVWGQNEIVNIENGSACEPAFFL